jgi:glycosyltransferase involved in cell wall biosynthesis
VLAKAKLLIVGTGPLESELKSLVADLDADVEFSGYLAGHALHDAIRSARAMVLPSQWYENAPISILEAYAMGVPVIGADIGGIPEMILGDETGAVFPSGSVESLAEKLVQFQNFSDLNILEMGRNARAFVEKEFSSQRHLENLLATYGELGVAC